MRELYLDRLGSPEHYVTADRADPADALVRYCGRLLQLLLWSSSLRTLRMGIAEAERVPEIASGYYEAVFEAPTARISAYVSQTWGLTQEEARRRPRPSSAELSTPNWYRVCSAFGHRSPSTRRDRPGHRRRPRPHRRKPPTASPGETGALLSFRGRCGRARRAAYESALAP
ncbi:TetR/AcrR family transcriptional regulator C-terminal domain-containing protein [Streptomyces sp. M19]